MFRAATALLAIFPARALDENSPHGRRCRGEEMSSIGKDSIAEAKPGLVHQRSCLERVPRLFPCHLRCRKASQFDVDQWEQFIRSPRVALLEGAKNTCDLAHSH